MKHAAFSPTRGTTVKRPHRQPDLLGARHSRLLAPDIAATLGFDTNPDQHAYYRHGHHDGLGHEQPLHLMNRYKQKWELNCPEDKVSDQSLICNASRRLQVIGHRAE